MVVAEKIFIAALITMLNLEYLFSPSVLLHYFMAFTQMIICLFFILYFMPININKYVKYCNSYNTNLIVIFFIYISMICISYIRSGLISTISLPLAMFNFTSLIVFTIFIASYNIRNNDCINLIIISVLCYVVINLVLSVVGINSESVFNTGNASILNLIGISVRRLTVPLSPAGGSVNFGTLSGLLLTMSTFGFASIKRKKYLYLSIIVISIIALLLSDTRGAILSFLLTLVTFAFFKTIGITKVRLLALLMPFIPLAIVTLLYFLYRTEYLDFFVRDQAADLTSGRIFIWASGVEELLNFNVIHLVGFGAYGQATSMVSDNYYFLFKDWPSDRPELFSLHSYLLQTIFDIGYLGLLLAVFMFYFAFKYAVNLSFETRLVVIGSFIFIIYSGITDTVPTYYNRESFFVVIVLISHTMFNRSCKITSCVKSND